MDEKILKKLCIIGKKLINGKKQIEMDKNNDFFKEVNIYNVIVLIDYAISLINSLIIEQKRIDDNSIIYI